jgi:hypothetical protein
MESMSIRGTARRAIMLSMIGAKAIDTITTADVLEVPTPVWTARPETARRVTQCLATALGRARALTGRPAHGPSPDRATGPAVA